MEEVLTSLLLFSTGISIQVFIKKFPHIIRERQDLQVFGILKSRFEFLGHVAKIFRFSHDFTDEPLLAVQIIVVKFFIKVLEHGDPLNDIETIVVISIISRPGVVVVVTAVGIGAVATITTAGL